MDSTEYKKKIRKTILDIRNSLSESEVADQSRIIAKQLFNTELYCNTDVIYSYISYRNEVATESIINRAFKDGKKVAVPRVHGDMMDFFFISSFEDLEPGSFKIPEPKEYTIRAVADVKTLMLIPGAVFDCSLHRIGYGKGYYDRYLGKNPDCFIKVALAYDFQILDEIFTEKHDVCMDMLISNTKIIRKN